MAEIELSVLACQCLHRRLPSRKEADRHIETWEQERNQHKVKINWRFTTKDARRKLKPLYPS